MTQPQKSSMFPIGDHWPQMYGKLEDECPCPIPTSASEDYWPKKLSSHLLTTSWWWRYCVILHWTLSISTLK